MIKVTVLDLLNAEDILTKIKVEAETSKLNLNLGFRLKKLFDKLTPEYKDIYEQRTKLFQAFGEKRVDDEGKEEIRIPAEVVPTFNKYWASLLETEIELFNVFKFTLEELEPMGLYSIDEAVLLEPFLKDFEAEPERRKINIDIDIDSNTDTKSTPITNTDSTTEEQSVPDSHKI